MRQTSVVKLMFTAYKDSSVNNIKPIDVLMPLFIFKILISRHE